MVDVLVANKRAISFWRSIGYADYALSLEILPGSDRLANNGSPTEGVLRHPAFQAERSVTPDL